MQVTKERRKLFIEWLNKNIQYHKIGYVASAIINTEAYGYSVKVDGKVYKFNDNYTRIS